MEGSKGINRRPRDILGSNIDPGICHFLTSVEVKSTDYKISG
jgi:hypothetical protein